MSDIDFLQSDIFQIIVKSFIFGRRDLRECCSRCGLCLSFVQYGQHMDGNSGKTFCSEYCFRQIIGVHIKRISRAKKKNNWTKYIKYLVFLFGNEAEQRHMLKLEYRLSRKYNENREMIKISQYQYPQYFWLHYPMGITILTYDNRFRFIPYWDDGVYTFIVNMFNS
jgi:hypothetical protein